MLYGEQGRNLIITIPVIEDCIGDLVEIDRDKRGAGAGLVRGVQMYPFTEGQGWRNGAEITLLTSQEESC